MNHLVTMMTSWSRSSLVTSLLAALALAAGCGRTTDQVAYQPLKSALARAGPPAAVSAAVGRADWKGVRQFYSERGYRTQWTSEGRLTSAFQEAVTILGQADRDALEPADYDIEWLRSERERLDGGVFARAAERPDEIVALELRATSAVLRWATHLSQGRFSPTRRGEWARPAKKDSPAGIIGTALDGGELGDIPAKLRPPHGEYTALLDLRRRFAALAAVGRGVRVKGNGTVRPGSHDPAIPSLRERLAAAGDLDEKYVNGSRRLDPPVADALRSFQERHGLTATGILDARSREELNVPADERLRQIDVNLERWRFAPRDLGSQHVRVNIPDYYLGLVSDGRIRLGMRVVVGERETPTPILSDEMRHIVFSPFWNIPDSITNDELLPALMNDPDYLSRNSIELVRVSDGSVELVDPESVNWSGPVDPALRFRQRPGASNALGHVKFVFPNHMSIYLHDTPAEGLFSRVTRALSHGCVRVERPADLAHALLGDTGWSQDRIEEAMYRGEERWVRLKQPVPVHLMYSTVWVDEAGRAQFRRDIYGHDARQGAALETKARKVNPSTKS